MTTPPQTPTAEGSHRDGWSTIEKVLTVVTALLVALTALFGFLAQRATSQKSNAEATISAQQSAIQSFQNAPTPTVTVTTTVPAAPGSGGGATPPDSTGPGSVYHKGQLTLSSTAVEAANLDAPQSDSGWTRSLDNSNGDIEYYGNGRQFTPYVGSQIKNADTDGSYQSCSAGGYGSAGIKILDISIGHYICVETDKGRYASLQLKSVNSIQAVFYAVIYNGIGTQS